MNGLIKQWNKIQTGSGVNSLSVSYSRDDSYRVVTGFIYWNAGVTKVWNYDASHIETYGGPQTVETVSYLCIGY